MDLLSLPDEMAASVFKYANYATVNRMRKMNCRINNVTKRFDIGTRFPVTSISFIDSFQFDPDNLQPVVLVNLELDAVNCHSNLSENSVTKFAMKLVDDNNSHLQSINKVLRKVEMLVNRYKIHGLHCTLQIETFTLPFDDELLAVFVRNQRTFRNMSMFTLLDSTVNCTEYSMLEFIASAKILRVYQIQHCEMSTDVLFHSKLFENRPWDNIHLYYASLDDDFKCSTLNDDFLLNVPKNCKECKIAFQRVGYTSFSIDGVIRMIEALIKENVASTHNHLELIDVALAFFGEAEDRIRAIHDDLHCKFDRYSYSPQDGTNRLITKKKSRVSFPVGDPTIIVEFNMFHIAQLELPEE